MSSELGVLEIKIIIIDDKSLYDDDDDGDDDDENNVDGDDIHAYDVP